MGRGLNSDRTGLRFIREVALIFEVVSINGPVASSTWFMSQVTETKQAKAEFSPFLFFDQSWLFLKVICYLSHDAFLSLTLSGKYQSMDFQKLHNFPNQLQALKVPIDLYSLMPTVFFKPPWQR